VERTNGLNRSGDRQANSALWHIVITRMVYDPRTSEYIDRRTKEGKSRRKRCDVSSAMSPVRSTAFSLTTNWGLTTHRSIVSEQPVKPKQ
jgi:hypothetical protein